MIVPTHDGKDTENMGPLDSYQHCEIPDAPPIIVSGPMFDPYPPTPEETPIGLKIAAGGIVGVGVVVTSPIWGPPLLTILAVGGGLGAATQ